MTSSLAIVVLVKNRQRHLVNLLRGVQQSTQSPTEVVVVHMNEPIQAPPDFFQGTYVGTMVHNSATALPLAAARNHGAVTAQGEHLIFLDVDCIPAPDLVKGYQTALTQRPEAIAMGGVCYLPRSLPETWQYDDLRQWGQPHPARMYPAPDQLVPTDDYPLFWSLSFALMRSTWETIGGFDEQFQGYGAEDTDFAFAAKAADVPLVWAGGAEAYHQHHPHYSPPLQHFHDIVKNATAFYHKWGWWPMEKWLQQFVEAGYIHWTAIADRIDIIAPPSAAAVMAARQ
ncbi:glycosyltransferase family 2 protein [Oscillatoria sp. CS-180]|uniref:glycosyltransferase family 2 protein n=1 Tax=Oscillatoria sp. CS-180 TaxID=3021720 RepID=UPI00232FB92F|nr:glycosyltransferase family 2 protein [Oscillatoria sp. CS-180]MDB9526752.1 glycosyltransferase family 2 protein [Oscillatoria sp. CS-180]